MQKRKIILSTNFFLVRMTEKQYLSLMEENRGVTGLYLYIERIVSHPKLDSWEGFRIATQIKFTYTYYS